VGPHLYSSAIKPCQSLRFASFWLDMFLFRWHHRRWVVTRLMVLGRSGDSLVTVYVSHTPTYPSWPSLLAQLDRLSTKTKLKETLRLPSHGINNLGLPTPIRTTQVGSAGLRTRSKLIRWATPAGTVEEPGDTLGRWPWPIALGRFERRPRERIGYQGASDSQSAPSYSCGIRYRPANRRCRHPTTSPLSLGKTLQAI
jgi:hypothetical protein